MKVGGKNIALTNTDEFHSAFMQLEDDPKTDYENVVNGLEKIFALATFIESNSSHALIGFTPHAKETALRLKKLSQSISDAIFILSAGKIDLCAKKIVQTTPFSQVTQISQKLSFDRLALEVLLKPHNVAKKTLEVLNLMQTTVEKVLAIAPLVGADEAALLSSIHIESGVLASAFERSDRSGSYTQTSSRVGWVYIGNRTKNGVAKILTDEANRLKRPDDMSEDEYRTHLLFYKTIKTNVSFAKQLQAAFCEGQGLGFEESTALSIKPEWVQLPPSPKDEASDTKRKVEPSLEEKEPKRLREEKK